MVVGWPLGGEGLVDLGEDVEGRGILGLGPYNVQTSLKVVPGLIGPHPQYIHQRLGCADPLWPHPLVLASVVSSHGLVHLEVGHNKSLSLVGFKYDQFAL